MINLLNQCQSERHANVRNIRNVLAPYSSAVQSEEDLSFYRRTYRDPANVHRQLRQITNRLSEYINQCLPKIISIADPYANPQTVSEKHQHEFAMPYLYQLLMQLHSSAGGVILLCPYCSHLLEKNHLVQIENVSLSDFIKYHLDKLTLLGRQCLYTKPVKQLFVLHLRKETAQL